MFVAEGQEGRRELRVHGADIMEKRAVHLVREQGDRGFAGKVDETLERVTGDDGTGGVLGIAILWRYMVST